MSSPTASFTAVNDNTGDIKTKRPDHNTMEGMIFDADELLSKFFDPTIKSEIPKNLFKSCIGVVFLKVVEAGFMISGSVGTGILFKRNPNSTTEWSHPIACGLTGLGWGFVIGGSIKDIIVFIFDQDTLKNMVYDKVGLRIGGQLEATLGNNGRAGNLDVTVSEKGIGNTVSYAFTQGALLSIQLQGSIVGARHKVNNKFYQRPTSTVTTSAPITADDIFTGTNIDIASISQGTKLQDVYTKLHLITSGAIPTTVPSTPTAVLNNAVKEGDDEPDIHFVEAPTETTK